MAISNTLTNSSLRKYLPSKVISGFAQSVANLESWLYDDGTGDPWWQGAAGTPIRWILTADVFSASHSSHLTRTPNFYTGLDVAPGMWVFSKSEPRAVRVVSIISKTDSSIQCVVEDVDRYNTFSDPTMSGAGIFAPSSDIIFFELGDDGLPILNPLPPNTDISNVSQIEARFRVFNPTVENRFFQLNHGFKEGQVLRIDPQTGKFVQATSNDIYIAGTVVAVGPGPNYFYLSPSTKIIKNLEPGLPGTAGDVIWLDTVTGDRTTAPNGSVAPIYIKMTNEVPAFTIGTVDNPTTWTDTSIRLNNEVVTFTAEGAVDTATIISTINDETSKHGVVASWGSPPNMVTGSVMYPISTVTSMQFTVNGVLSIVTTPSINFGDSGQIGWWDIIRSVNEQEFLHGVYASFDSNTGLVSFQNASGGPVDFVNIEPASSIGDAKTLTDMVGVAESNQPATATKIKLVRSDGGQITITDVSGSFSADTGIQSADNGSLPLALVVDASIGATNNYVVANIAGRDALSNLRSGDQVFVQSANSNNEWALFVKTGSTWTKISDQDSANTDASTLTVEIDFSTGLPVSLGSLSPGSRVVDISVVVEQVFNGSAPTLTVGTMDSPSLVMDNNILDLTHIGEYESGTSYINEETTEQELFVHFSSTGSTTGSAKVIVSYL